MNLLQAAGFSRSNPYYIVPQGRITDHRINLTLYKLEEVIEGDLDALVEPLIQEHQADQLKNLSEN